MKFYAKVAAQLEPETISLDNGQWSLYCDVKCEDCGKEYSLAAIGGVGGPCPRCGGRCL
jgi:hypothetical protein